MDIEFKDDIPVTNQLVFELPTLYRISKNGIRVWKIGFDGSNLCMSWGTLEAFQNGTQQESKTPVELRSKQTLLEQATLDANARWKDKQMKEGMRTEPVEHDVFRGNAMLATKWNPQGKQIKEYPVAVMPKLNGIRCLAYVDDTVTLQTRGCETIHNFDSIRQALLSLNQVVQHIVSHYYPEIDPSCRFDGELYTTDIPFEEINGMARLSTRKHPKEHLMKYNIFDLILTKELSFDNRYTILKLAFSYWSSAIIELVDCYLAKSKDEIVSYHKEFVNQGYEGIIIRRPNSLYIHGRGTAMYKYKDFEDDEFLVVGASPATGNQSGAIVWTVKTQNGKTFDVVPKDRTIEQRRQDYLDYKQNPNQFIGQKYRVKYQELSKHGVPVFPSGLGFVYDR